MKGSFANPKGVATHRLRTATLPLPLTLVLLQMPLAESPTYSLTPIAVELRDQK